MKVTNEYVEIVIKINKKVYKNIAGVFEKLYCPNCMKERDINVPMLLIKDGSGENADEDLTCIFCDFITKSEQEDASAADDGFSNFKILK